MATSKLQGFLSERSIPCAGPSSPEFASLQESFSGRHNEARPSMITRPQRPEDVANIVEYCVDNGLEIAVRGGAHDLWGRFQVANTVSIDMRDLHSVKLSPDNKTARVGGGATGFQVLEALQQHGYMVAIGTCGIIGFTGWSIIGGYGAYVQTCGLGADQIAGALIVNSEGKLIEANDRMLKSIRGGGANVGVIAELVVKMQTGMIFFHSSDMRRAATDFFNEYNRLFSDDKSVPNELHLIPCCVNLPGAGPTLGCSFVWHGRRGPEFENWLDRTLGLGRPLSFHGDPRASIESSDPLSFAKAVGAVIPRQSTGHAQSVSLSHLSPGVIARLASLFEQFPTRGSTSVFFHSLRASSPSCSAEITNSVCPYRTPHFMLELLGFGAEDQESQDVAAAWALNTRNQLMEEDAAMKMTYFPLTSPEFLRLEDIYGDRLEELKAIKREYDPQNVFCNALPKLGS